MATVTVYRLQGNNGDGPFQSRAFMKSFPALYEKMGRHADKNHPLPWDKGEPFEDFRVSDIPFCYRYGVLWRNQLDDWFPMLAEIVATGLFQVVALEINEKNIILGNSQVAFTAD